MSKPLTEALAQIKATQKQVNSLLKQSEHVQTLLAINALFDRMATRLEFVGGVLEQDQETKDSKTKHQWPPITDFMGESIKIEKPVTAEDLEPGKTAKELFVAKVNSLYYKIGEMDPDTVLKSYTNADDVLILRGVAKRANVTDFGERELTIDFIEDIQLGIGIKKEEAQKQKKIDEGAEGERKKLAENEEGNGAAKS
jgi:hypothetical protein